MAPKVVAFFQDSIKSSGLRNPHQKMWEWRRWIHAEKATEVKAKSLLKALAFKKNGSLSPMKLQGTEIAV